MHDESTEKPSLERLNAQLAALKKTQQPKPVTKNSVHAAKGAIDFASASAVGIVLGFAADDYFLISPWGLVVGLTVGVITGMYLLLRSNASSPTKNE